MLTRRLDVTTESFWCSRAAALCDLGLAAHAQCRTIGKTVCRLLRGSATLVYTTQRNRRCNSISTGQRLNTGNGRTHIKMIIRNKDRATAAASSLSLLPPVTALRQQNCVAACQSFQLDQRKSSSMHTALLLNKSLCFSAELCSTSRGTSHVRICALGLSSLLVIRQKLLSFNYSIRAISTNDGCTLII